MPAVKGPRRNERPYVYAALGALVAGGLVSAIVAVTGGDGKPDRRGAGRPAVERWDAAGDIAREVSRPKEKSVSASHDRASLGTERPSHQAELVAAANDESSRHRRRRMRRADGARGGGTGTARRTVFASEADAQYETQSQSDAIELEGLTGDGGTISFWIQPAWNGASQDDASFVRIGDGQLRVYKNVSYLRVEITDADGQKVALGVPIASWNPGDWHQVVSTWDGRYLSLFLDGVLVSQHAYDGQLELPPDAKLYLGTNEPPPRPIAAGVLTNVRVRAHPLSPYAVSRRFHATKPQ